jgi:acetoin utilization deacetylase AcuC-like enzyme
MATALITHSACLYHETPVGHPESPDRLKAVLRRMDGPEFTKLRRLDAPLASRDQIGRVHPAYFVEAILNAVPERGLVQVDGDTILSPGSGEAALRAAGALVMGVDRVMTGEIRNAFCAVRPPGHHAEPTDAMGFCVFNNVAIGALHARVSRGLNRVAVLDFDVHHGNGTQAMFVDDPDLFFGSTHQMPLYPGTGRREERGRGNICNVPLPPGAGGQDFRQAWDGAILPALEAFRPEFVLISAGFDGHRDDPLANLNLTEADFAWVTQRLCRIAAATCDGRIVSTLEGGYDLEALAESCAAHVRVLMEH